MLLAGLTPLSVHATDQTLTSATTAQQHTQSWLISADQARQLISSGATVLDARADELRTAQPLDGAQAVSWKDFSQPKGPQQGRLSDDDQALTAKLRALGISAQRPVLVLADNVKGWGEDGRVAWTLRTLGHPQALIVDGGIAALLNAGPVTITRASAGDFTVQRNQRWSIERDELRALIGRNTNVILDTRELREYAGATPYGESRGGHVPGAQPLFYKELLGADGKLLPAAQLQAKLQQRGVTADQTIVTYCTGGVRAAWVTAVLSDLGYSVRNYAGSMWEWSSAPAEQYPLVSH